MSESEWLTGKTRIDRRLTEARPGWAIVPHRDGLDLSTLTAHGVTEFPAGNGPRGRRRH